MNESSIASMGEAEVHHEDLGFLLPKLQVECYLHSLQDSHDEDGTSLCPRIWDGLLCWPPTPANTTTQLSCPSYVPGFDTTASAMRLCTESATWYFNVQENQTWTNYSACGSPTAYDPGNYNVTLIEQWVPVIKKISQIGYGFSLGTLLISLCILATCKKLHCPRNTLHMHLFISFIMRAFMALLKDNLFVDGLVEVILPAENMAEPTSSTSDINVPDYPAGTWQCKVVTSFWQYFILANYSWILMEGLYLHNLIFMALFTDSSAITMYIILGWGLPLFFTTLWIILRALLENHLCWTTNANPYIFWSSIRAPITASVLINLVFFLHIAWVLLSKLRSSVSAETRKYRYRKWAKSTLVLMPLFGVHYTVYCVMHGVEGMTEGVELVLLFCDQLFTSFQGFLVSVLYCLLNGEVRGEISRRWKRFRQDHNLESPWAQYSTTANHSRATNTTRWRTSLAGSHSVQITSIGDHRRSDLRLQSLTPPLAVCYTNHAHVNNHIGGSNPDSLHQSSMCNSSVNSVPGVIMRASCSKSSTVVTRLEKIASESEENEQEIRSRNPQETISLNDLITHNGDKSCEKSMSKTSL